MQIENEVYIGHRVDLLEAISAVQAEMAGLQGTDLRADQELQTAIRKLERCKRDFLSTNPYISLVFPSVN
jgi:hypothetical protein